MAKKSAEELYPQLRYSDGIRDESKQFPTGTEPGSVAHNDRPAMTASFFRKGVIYELDEALDEIESGLKGLENENCLQLSAGITRSEEHLGMALGLLRGVPKDDKWNSDEYRTRAKKLNKLQRDAYYALTNRCMVVVPKPPEPEETLSGLKKKRKTSRRKKK